MSSESAVVQVDSIDAKPSGWHELVDGNGQRYSTKKLEIVEHARRYVGEQATIHFTVKQVEKDGRTFINRYLDKIEDGPAQPPPLGTGEYVSAQKPPIEVRRIFASTAWNCAARMANGELGFDAMKHQADKIFHDLLVKGKAIEDEDIPF